MDKLTVITDTALMAANVFAIVSLQMYYWIIPDFADDTHLGSMWSSMTLYSRPQVGYTLDAKPEWLLALLLCLLCTFIGVMILTNSVILLASTLFDRGLIPHARGVGLTAMILSLAAVIFPMGFHVDEIGGQAYQLPNSHQVGISYHSDCSPSMDDCYI